MNVDQPISIRFRNEESDFLRIMWRLRRRSLFIAFLLICFVLGAFSLYALMATPSDPSNDRRWVVYATSLVVPLFVAVVMYFALRSHARKAAASTEVVSMTFDDEGIEIDGPSSSSKSDWKAYVKVVDTPDDFVFYLQSNIFFGVPKRFFNDSREIQRVQELVSEHSRK